jgi:hypothetical protein
VQRWRLSSAAGALRPEVIDTEAWFAGYSPDGKYLALAGYRGTRLLSRAAGREVPWPQGRQLATAALAFSPDGRIFATSDRPPKTPRGSVYTRGAVYLWETATRQPRGRLQGHFGEATCFAFSPNGKALFSGSIDPSILIWDLYGAGRDVEVKPLTRDELRARWEELAGADAVKAFAAIRALVQDPERAVPFLADHLRGVKPPARISPERAQELIRALDDRNFAVRERATRGLIEQGEAVAPALARALEGQLPLEVRRRLTQVLDRVLAGPPPEQLRLLRAAEVLERIGTAEARRVLKSLPAP